MHLITPSYMRQNVLRVSLFIFLFISSLQSIHAQSNPRARTGAFSIGAGYVDNISNRAGEGSGFQVGANMYRRNAEKISYEAQLSVTVNNGDIRRITPLSVIGVRYYITSNENTKRLFVNALAGFAMQFRQANNDTDTTPDIGYSVGVFLQTRHLVYGFSIESPENLVFKIGLTI